MGLSGSGKVEESRSFGVVEKDGTEWRKESIGGCYVWNRIVVLVGQTFLPIFSKYLLANYSLFLFIHSHS